MTALYHRQLDYTHLRVFGCLCYPNTSSTSSHKLDTRLRRCVFIGYPKNFRGYRCLDLATGKTHLSHHVTFDEFTFPYANSATPPDHSFLDTDPSPAIFTQPTVGTAPNPSIPSSPRLPPIIHTYHRRNPHNPRTPNCPAHSSVAQPTAAQLSPSAPPTAATAPAAPTVSCTHSMTTRSQTGHLKPNTHLNLHTATISSLPTSPTKALSVPHWRAAMNDEYKALMDNYTWDLVPRPKDA